MSEEKGFLISVIIMLAVILIFALGEVKHNPCDFAEVGMYQDWSSGEFTKCP